MMHRFWPRLALSEYLLIFDGCCKFFKSVSDPSGRGVGGVGGA
jgi:hypothetical protein